MDIEDVQYTRLKTECIHFKNTLRLSINAAKRLYYLRTFALYRNDIKQTWSVIKDTLQKKLHSAPSNKIISSFFFFRKNYLLLSCATSVRPSVRLSVCPSVCRLWKCFLFAVIRYLASRLISTSA